MKTKDTSIQVYKETKRLILRPLETYDYENWVQAYSSMRAPQNEWDETSWIDSELTVKKYKEHLKKHLNWRKQDHYYQMGVFRKDDGMLIGYISLMDISRELFQNAYLGYRIFNNHWGQGYATEACQAAIDIAFKTLNLHRIEAGISPSNKRSIKVAKKIGMRKEGVSSRRLFINNKWVDLALFAVTTEDLGKKWKPLRR